MEQYLKIGAVTFFFCSPCTRGTPPMWMYSQVLLSSPTCVTPAAAVFHRAKLKSVCYQLSSPQSTSPGQNPDSSKMPLCSVPLWGRDSLRARTRPGDGREKAGFYNGLSSDKDPLRRWKAGRLLDVA